MTARLAEALLVLFPGADPRKDFRVEDHGDGEGPHIVEWNLSEKQPSQDQIAAAAATLPKED
jgi:hypothetical protein